MPFFTCSLQYCGGRQPPLLLVELYQVQAELSGDPPPRVEGGDVHGLVRGVGGGVVLLRVLNQEENSKLLFRNISSKKKTQLILFACMDGSCYCCGNCSPVPPAP